MTPSQEQIHEWKEKYGTVYELSCEDKTAYVFDPCTKLPIIKAFMTALIKGSVEAVECLLNNCWIDGDPDIKTDDQLKIGLVDQVNELIEMPDADIEFDDARKEAAITVEGKTCRVRLASRQDIKYAEDKNKSGKPLDTQIYLLEKIAIDDLAEWRNNTRLYVGLLTAVDKVKDRKYVSLKKL